MSNPSYSPIGNAAKRQKIDDTLDNVDLSDDDLANIPHNDNNNNNNNNEMTSPPHNDDNDNEDMPNADIEHLTLQQLKSETVRLEYEAARIQTRLTLAKSRIARITAFHRGNTTPQRGTRADRMKCIAAGCTSHAQMNGLCQRHGEYVGKRCRYKGCTNHVQNDGLCYRHGATITLCGVEGCSNRVQRKGVCYKHGARLEVVTCSVRSCRNVAKVGGLCKKHRDAMDTNTNINDNTNTNTNPMNSNPTNPDQMMMMMPVVDVPNPEDVCQVVPTDVATTYALTTGGVDDHNQQPQLPEGDDFETKGFSMERDDQCG